MRCNDVIDELPTSKFKRYAGGERADQPLAMTSSLPPLAQAWSGALGSATANSISYPLDLVATKLQTARSRKLQGLPGVLRLLKHVLHTEGFTGLYDGLSADTASTLVSKYVRLAQNP